jgi:hypothetical protein
MTPEEREKMVDDLIAAENKEKERQKQLAEEQKLKEGEANDLKNQAMFNENTRNRPQSQANVGAWYFYNQSTVSFGFNEFTKKWGERKLEDNWRRKNKQSISLETEEEDNLDAPDLTAYNDSIAKLDDKKRKEAYLSNVTMSDTAIASSNKKMIDAYYSIGIIYREQLKEYRLSIEAFETLLKRFPGNKYEQACYFNLYRTYKLVKDDEKSNYYKDILINNYPESEFTKQVLNPNYWRDKQKKTEILEVFYENTYKAYHNRQYDSVIERKSTAEELYPKNRLMPKFEYLKALSIGKIKRHNRFRSSAKKCGGAVSGRLGFGGSTGYFKLHK